MLSSVSRMAFAIHPGIQATSCARCPSEKDFVCGFHSPLSVGTRSSRRRVVVISWSNSGSSVSEMDFTLAGMFLLARADGFSALLGAALCVGVGSAVFHPESSRVARMASGGRHGLAQSLFQVGGNAGSAIGPLLAAFVVVPHGQQ